jgi:hypothetical protein
MNRKLILVFTGFTILFLLACNATFSIGTPTQTALPPTQAPPTATAIPLSGQVTVVAVPFIETDPGSTFPQYTLTTSTPQLSGSDDPRVQAFNQRLSALVQKEVDQWRQDFRQLPITPLSNGSSLQASYTLISQTNDLWSFKFDFSFYADTAAHPGSYSVTVNYDLGTGKELALSDLFMPNSNYLEAISNYCLGELRKQPYSDSFFLDGAKPTVENYRNWNISPDGILITFDAYQVAPYASGPQHVTVPYEQLKSLIAPQGPLSNFIR